MKIALVHDGLFTRGGAERVLLNFQKAFPEAPIFTTVYHKNNTYPEFKDSKIITSWLQFIAVNELLYKLLFFPLGILAAKSLDLREYDVVLCSTTHCGKYIKTKESTLVINYCYTPFRLAWNPSSYNLSKNILVKTFLNQILKILRSIDYKYAQRANYYIAMTEETSLRIKSCYEHKNHIEVINPSIDTKQFVKSKNLKNYFLVVSRLEEYKKVNIVIEAFNELNLPLVIIGSGTQEKQLKKISKSNIKFYKNISDNELKKFYSEARALIFPQYEDYGLTVLESYASGRPAICFDGGGSKYTGIPFNKKNMHKATMLTFKTQDCIDLKDAITRFDDNNFNSNNIINHAKGFDDSVFIKKIINFVNNKYLEHNVR
ncbi:glycosyltransferase [Candidatus Marinimicrobia bacterium]|nr:glycosyltransferase [Candidatus Neomarinimicrobiota bacterium]